MTGTDPIADRSAVPALLIGPFDRPEFAAPLAMLEAWTAAAPVASIAAGLRHIRESGAPCLIVLAQPRPGMYAASEVARLRAAAPLARLVVLLGSWCEGETRTGTPWPGVLRVFWYDWPAECEPILRALSERRFQPWAIAATANEEDRLLAGQWQAAHRGDGLVALCTPWNESADALADACTAHGYATVWLRPDAASRFASATAVRGVQAAIWEETRSGTSLEDSLQRLARDLPGVPLLALCDFPRWETYERAKAVGACAVLARPVSIDHLLWHLERAVGAPASRAAGEERAA